MNTETLMAKLFRWKLTTEYNGIKFHIRVVSDQVVDDARKSGLLEARKMRRWLRDPESDEYLLYLDPLADLTDEELRNMIILTAMREIMRDYMQRNARPSVDELGDYPTQEQQEQFEASKEERDAAYVEGMQEYVETWRKEYTARLESMDRATVEATAKRHRVDQVCEDIFTKTFEEHVVAASIFTDDKYTTRLLTLDQFRELPTEVKQFLRDAYNNMTIGPDDLKN